MKKLMTTPFGTFLKGFIASMLALWMAEKNLFSFDIEMVKKIAGAALFANLPVIINALNPKYTLYGKGKVNNEDQGDDDLSNKSGLVTALIFFIALTALVSACNP